MSLVIELDQNHGPLLGKAIFYIFGLTVFVIGWFIPMLLLEELNFFLQKHYFSQLFVNGAIPFENTEFDDRA
ncbi:MAG: hypothetical protein VXW65_08470 [Pseudomonadota bacterium]|nr:hypothetical protein [Pseudomonadota bacterium]